MLKLDRNELRCCAPSLLMAIVFVFQAAAAAGASDTVLVDAAERRDFDTLNRLMEETGNVQAEQPDGTTALHWVVRHDVPELARKLIEMGANVQAKNRYGVTPLFLACQNGSEELVELLLNAGADHAIALPGGETPLMTAARTGRLGPVTALIARGANVNALERRGQTSLMWAAAEGHADVVDALIIAGADVDARLPSGFTALFFAVREGRIDATRRLLEAGSDVNEIIPTAQGFPFGRDKLKMNPLLMAVENGHFELAKMLLDAGADPNAQPTGYSPLHALTWIRKPIRGDGDPPPRGSGKYHSLEMVRILIAAGADVNARLLRGKSELGRFTYTGSTPFLLAAQASDLPLVKLLAELGADVQLPNADNTSPLLAATGVGALGDGDESAGTEEEAMATVEFLLDQGADINAVDHNGETVMHGAAYQSLPELAELLLRRGASIDVWNRENRAGWTPCVIALGYRPGNFRPSPSTISVIESAMVNAGLSLPDPSQLGSHQRSWTAVKNVDQPWVLRNMEYGRINDTSLRLDLHLPQHVKDASLIVWVHGGAWRSGSKEEMPLAQMVQAGYVVASVDYRLSPIARFPAQVHDIKGAIRYLRFLAPRYGYRQDRIAIAGASAGGHLAALVGTTNENVALEGTIGEHADQSSAVHAIVDLFGPTNLMSILSQSTPHGLSVRVPALDLLLGGSPEQQTDLAKLASPTEHVDGRDPPLLMIHGDQDPQVPINQSHELQGKYDAFQLPARLEVIHGVGHGGAEFYDEERIRIFQSFLEQHLRHKK